MDDEDKKDDLLIHVMIGASDFAKIKTPTKPRIGRPEEPIAELTNFGWTIMSPGHEPVSTNALLTRTKEVDFEKLWSLDVLGLEDKAEINTIRIRESDRDVLRFHWPKDRGMENLEVNRFSRILFGLNQSPFILGATLEKHLSDYEDKFPSEISEIKRSLFVDAAILGGSSIEEVKHLKETTEEVFGEAQFKLYKWHTNSSEISQVKEVETETENSFTKQHLGVKNSETKILGSSIQVPTLERA
eukprot:gene2764-biopygen2282